MTMTIALFGAAGQVGSDCHRQLLNAGYSVIAWTRDNADFVNPETVAALVKSAKPAFIINACAYTAVDKAEAEQEVADLVNHQSVAALATACADLKIPLLHISTDYVFDGEATQPYAEDDPVNPLGIYGSTKLAGEQAIQDVLSEHIIIRTSWVFGEAGNNFVKTMLRVGAERQQLKVVNDQHGSPTYAGDIAKVILSFVDCYCDQLTLPWGVYHCTNEGETTWYDFACAIFDKALSAKVLDKTPEILPIPSSEFPTPAARPAYSVLATEKLTQFMGQPLPHWQQGLEQFLKNIK